MEKYSRQTHAHVKQLMPYSYFSTDVYLDFAAYVFERNGELLVVWQDILYPNEFPCVFTPQYSSNWEYAVISFATEEDIKKIQNDGIDVLIQNPMGEEFFYETATFTTPTGKLKSRIQQFTSQYTYTITHTCDRETIQTFYLFWKSQKKHESITFEESEEFFYYCLDHLEEYDIRQVYVYIEKQLVGFAWGVLHPESNNWVGLHLKVDYTVKGLSRFLHHKRALLFEDHPTCTLGTGVHDVGIRQFKKELGPIDTISYTYLLTGKKST
jgi:hypothetical protein